MFYLSTNIAAETASDAAESYICLPIAAKLNSVRLVPDVAVTAHDTNYVTVLIVDNAGSNLFSQTTKTTSGGGGGDLTAGTAIPVTFTGGSTEFDAGEKVKLRSGASGSGVVSAFTAVFEFEPSRGL